MPYLDPSLSLRISSHLKLTFVAFGFSISFVLTYDRIEIFCFLKISISNPTLTGEKSFCFIPNFALALHYHQDDVYIKMQTKIWYYL